MTVLVTGASGHLGINLTRALLAEGRRVRALVHNHSEGLDELDVEQVHGSTTDLDSLLKAMKGVEVVYHLAGIISVSGKDEPVLTEVNVKGTANVARACLETGVRRMVHTSSTHALEEQPWDTPVDEGRPLCDHPRHLPYDNSKGRGEKALQEAVEEGLDAVTVNPCGVLGPWDYAPSRMGQVLLDLAHRKMPALVNGKSLSGSPACRRRSS
jgi:dihydroflavonol-4-reductase